MTHWAAGKEFQTIAPEAVKSVAPSTVLCVEGPVWTCLLFHLCNVILLMYSS